MEAHAGQVDKAGEPYILHPLRVMLSPAMTSEALRICAVLHDVVEDSNYTFEDLKAVGFSVEIIKVIDLLTRRKNETYDDFISRICTDIIACRIKTADLLDNANLARIKEPKEEDIQRIQKYYDALAKNQEAQIDNGFLDDDYNENDYKVI